MAAMNTTSSKRKWLDIAAPFVPIPDHPLNPLFPEVMADFPGILDQANSGRPSTETTSLGGASVGQITGSAVLRDREESYSNGSSTDSEDRLNQPCNTSQDAELEHPAKKVRVAAATPGKRSPKREPLNRAAIHKKEPRRKTPRKSRTEKALQNTWTTEMIEAQQLLLGRPPSPQPPVPDALNVSETSLITDDFEAEKNEQPHEDT
ncbi:MAG: hypothetical protein Q9186_004935 [Xanthomendoza sp. 1 TL-2023]